VHLDDLLQIAESDNWVPKAGGVVLSRASWWAWQATPIDDLLELYRLVGDRRPEALAEWQFAAMIGAAQAFRGDNSASKMLAALALLGFGDAPPLADVVTGCRNAQRAASQFELSDPLAQLPAAASSLAREGRCMDPEVLVAGLSAALMEAEEND
jgi:hypothetical protein